MACFSPLALFARSGHPPKIIMFPLLAVAGIYQIYFWGLWSAFCVAVTIQFTQKPEVSWDWLYWVFGFMESTSLIAWLSHKERQTSRSVQEVRGIEKGTILYSLVAIIAFFIFALSPSLMIPPFGWALKLVGYSPPRAADIVSSKVEEKYFQTFDDWVRRGGPFDEVQNTVVWTCGKLVTLKATPEEREGFLKTQRAEFDFRVDVCVKMIANRVYPQPEFQKKEFVISICDKSRIEPFTTLCKRSGLR